MEENHDKLKEGPNSSGWKLIVAFAIKEKKQSSKTKRFSRFETRREARASAHSC